MIIMVENDIKKQKSKHVYSINESTAFVLNDLENYVFIECSNPCIAVLQNSLNENYISEIMKGNGYGIPYNNIRVIGIKLESVSIPCEVTLTFYHENAMLSELSEKFERHLIDKNLLAPEHAILWTALGYVKAFES